MRNIFKLNPQVSMASKIAIYGAGKSGRNVKKKLNHMGIDVHAFIDSDELKMGTICDGIMIHEINWLKENNAICIIPGGFQEEIYMVCHKNSIKNLFLDFKEGFEVILAETTTQSLYALTDEIRKKKIYILGTGKYSRRLFILLNSVYDNIKIEGFLRFSLDKNYTGNSIFNHKIFNYTELADDNIAIFSTKINFLFN